MGRLTQEQWEQARAEYEVREIAAARQIRGEFMTEFKSLVDGVEVKITRHVPLADLYAWIRLGERAARLLEEA